MARRASTVPRAASVGEETLLLHCRAYGLAPEREYKFCERGWKFDFAFPGERLAVEVEGGTRFGKSRHSRGDGFENDARKYNRAAVDGWRVLRYTTEMVTSGEAIDDIRALTAASGAGSSGPPSTQRLPAAIDTSAWLTLDLQ